MKVELAGRRDLDIATRIRLQEQSQRERVEQERILALPPDKFLRERRDSYEECFRAFRQLETIPPDVSLDEIAAALSTASLVLTREYFFDSLLGAGQFGDQTTLDERLATELARKVPVGELEAFLTTTSFETIWELEVRRVYLILVDGSTALRGALESGAWPEPQIREAVKNSVPGQSAVRRLARRYLLGKHDAAEELLIKHRGWLDTSQELRASIRAILARIRSTQARRIRAREAILQHNPSLHTTVCLLDEFLRYTAYRDSKKHILRGHLALTAHKGALATHLKSVGVLPTGDGASYSIEYLLELFEKSKE